MRQPSRNYPQSQPNLGPVLVLRGSLIMTLLLFIIFSWLANGVARAEEAQPDLPVTATSIPAETKKPGCKVSQAYPEKVRRWCEWITEYSKKNELPPDLVAAVIWQESGGDPGAYSHSGAVGLMQVMPRDGIAASFICQNGPCFASRPTIAELEDPEYNIAYGTQMLAGLNQRFGDLRVALKSYGPMDVGFSYADTVLGLYQQYRSK